MQAVKNLNLHLSRPEGVEVEGGRRGEGGRRWHCNGNLRSGGNGGREEGGGETRDENKRESERVEAGEGKGKGKQDRTSALKTRSVCTGKREGGGVKTFQQFVDVIYELLLRKGENRFKPLLAAAAAPTHADKFV